MTAPTTPGPWAVAKGNAKRVISNGKQCETGRRSVPATVAVCESPEDAQLIATLFNDARRAALAKFREPA